MNIIAVVLFICLAEAIAQTCLRSARFSNKNKCGLMILAGMLFYTLVAWMLYRAYGYSEMGHTNLIWSCLSIVVAFIIGKVLFGERMDQNIVIALFLALAAIYFAHRSDETINHGEDLQATK